MNDGLKDKHRAAIVRILAANDRIEGAVLFGSRAMETHTSTSDVDIALFGDSLTLTDQADIASAVEELSIPQRVDLLLYKMVDDHALLAHIERHGVAWYRREPRESLTHRKSSTGSARIGGRKQPGSSDAALIDMGLDRPIDVTADQRKTLLALLKRHLPNTTAWVYGSRVKWTARPQSDLDLVVFAKPDQERRVSELREAFEESNLPFRVDLFVWDAVPEQFRKQIEADHVVLVEKEEQGAVSEWTRKTLGALTENFDAVRVPIKEAERRPGPYPYYGASGIVDSIDDYLFNGEYLLIAEDGENLRTRNTPIAFLANGKFWVNNHAHIVRGNHEANTRYLMYALSELDISGYLTGSTMPKLTQGNMNQISLLMPPLPEQSAIAHVLGTLDDKIELNRRINETLEAMARALFKSWFVDFDPVRAKMAGRDPGLPQHLADLFPDHLVDSELGPIPEGWEVVPLPEIIAINPTRSLQKGEVAPYLDMANMPTRGHAPDILIDRPFGSGMRFANGDTLVARITPCLENGKTAYVDFLKDGEVGWGSTEYMVMRPKLPLPNEFAYCLARSVSFRKFAIQNMTGTSGRQRVPAIALSQFLLPSPPKQIAAIFGRVAQPLFARASEAVRESRTLAALRDALLPKLASGEMKVRNIA